jgi:hypothetical protein
LFYNYIFDTGGKVGLGLIKKTLPDLTSTTLSGDENNPVRGKVEVVFVQPSQD